MDTLNTLVAHHNQELTSGATQIQSFWAWLDEKCTTINYSNGEEAEWELESILQELQNSESEPGAERTEN